MKIRNWNIFFFITGYHLLLLLLLPLFISTFTWPAAVLFLITYAIGGLSITAGYHRLYAHKAFNANPVYEWAVLIGSTLAVQWSARIWAHDHRLHHAHVDTDEDPYSIKKGFWYAHMGWLFSYQRQFQPKYIRDLEKNPRVRFQDRYYLPLTLGVNGAIFGIGCLFMHPLASLYAGFLLRVFTIHHCTWFINSLAHVWGSKTFARELSAVDNGVLAFLTFGEGYHNYHHAFASDYRNGIRWFHFDPTKWLVWLASKSGMVKGLRTTNQIRIQRTLLSKDKKMLSPVLSSQLDDLSTDIRDKLDELEESFETKANAFMERLAELKTASREQRSLIKFEVRRLKRELKATWKAWLSLTQYAVKRYQVHHAHSH